MIEDDELLSRLRDLPSPKPRPSFHSHVATRAERVFLDCRSAGTPWHQLGLIALLLGCEGVCVAQTIGLLARVFG